jgi:hypothetical protein
LELYEGKLLFINQNLEQAAKFWNTWSSPEVDLTDLQMFHWQEMTNSKKFFPLHQNSKKSSHEN